MAKLRIAFIGCGGVSNGHAQRIIAMRNAKIVALCDTNAKTLTAYKTRHTALADAPTFEDWRKMLDAVEVDAVEIHTPHTLHYEQIMESLDRGLHVLAEKPMVCTIKHAEEVVKKVQETGLKLQVSYQRHFDQGFRYARQVIAKGALGTLHFISALQSQDWKRSQTGAWRQIPALSGGGQLNDSGSHLVDIILWVSGLVPADVSAFIDNSEREVDINSAVNVRFQGGAQASISIVGESVRWWEDITFWGEKGMLVFRNGQLQQFDSKGEVALPKRMPKSTDPDRNFVDAILGKDELQVPVECGLRVIQLTEAAWQSAETGKTVSAEASRAG